MKRVVYSPRVWAWIKCEDPDTGKERTVDVSQYIVSGSVTRNVNAVSEAELVLRNPGRMWTDASNEGKRGKPLFRPMDPITIWMMRRPGHPVQVFTGYLDRSPYYQLYPGVVTLMASCTLKRLMHTYFDAGLPYTMAFLARYGWMPSGNTGTFFHAPSHGSQLSDKEHFIDGGFAALLFGTMKHIGRWNPKHILIEGLPPKIEEKIGRVFQAFRDDIEDDNKRAQKELQSFLASMIGTGSYGGAGGGVDPSLRGNKNVEKAFNYLRDKGLTAEQAAGAVGSMMGESGIDLNPTAEEGPYPKGYGIAQWSFERRAALEKQSNYQTLATQLRFLWSELTGEESAALTALKGAKTTADAVNAWTRVFERPLHPDADVQKRIPYAQSVYAEYANNDPDNTDDEDVDPRVAGETGSQRDDDAGEPNSTQRVNPLPATYMHGAQNYGEQRSTHRHAGEDYACPEGTPLYAVHSGTVHWKTDSAGYGTYIDLDHGDGTWSRYAHMSKRTATNGQRVKAGDRIGDSGNTGRSSGPHLHFEIRSGEGYGFDGTVSPAEWLSGAVDAPEGDTAGGGTGGSTEAHMGTASAFAAQITLPSAAERAESLLLQGEKSLMNDEALLPFIQQLAEGSMRHFQSLPDGRFFAFFPDYFGEWGKEATGKDLPYLEIDDVEILDGTIDLTDDNVVTHQYVVGDTIPFGGGSDAFAERILTSGVVTVFNVFDSNGDGDNALVPGFGGAKGKEAALKFLRRYGARPQVETAPFVRSPYFELLVAYQRFLLNWSRQFQTNFTFTFMPELYPGGKVGFKNHGIKMYIESVTHSFDYSGGFTTSAVLTAPAAYNNNSPLEDSLLRNA